ncbi:MAG: hypothetical protein QOF01_3087 [Thermomicrobiales bacterium]|nr:hypothetical protein [Thermomicrobiales bacterium]
MGVRVASGDVGTGLYPAIMEHRRFETLLNTQCSGQFLDRVADDVRIGGQEVVVVGAAPGHRDGGETGGAAGERVGGGVANDHAGRPGGVIEVPEDGDDGLGVRFLTGDVVAGIDCAEEIENAHELEGQEGGLATLSGDDAQVHALSFAGTDQIVHTRMETRQPCVILLIDAHVAGERGFGLGLADVVTNRPVVGRTEKSTDLRLAEAAAGSRRKGGVERLVDERKRVGDRPVEVEDRRLELWHDSGRTLSAREERATFVEHGGQPFAMVLGAGGDLLQAGLVVEMGDQVG